jgi:2-polyprenyl-6-methoxyphenol hydroxylase-like FAD-dependent oxidoreductase
MDPVGRKALRMANEIYETTCCVVGGGPAGMMLGYLLARAGVAVTVLEKHNDFFRDFRGDTVHPSTLELMYELGILEDFLKVPHQKVETVGGIYGDYPFQIGDFRYLPTHCKFVALMPQWDFLNFLAGKAKQFPAFNLRMQHQAVDLMHDDGRITGVAVQTPDGPVQIRADLVVGCDGRHSITRPAAHLEVQEFGVPIDVLWFRITRTTDDPEQLLGNINYGKVLILIPRNDYFQAGLIIPKGSFEEVKRQGLDALRNLLRRIAPYLGDRVEELSNWDQISLLTVQINRLRQWHRPGLLCIGDAAHAMSPAGGVGINLAIQDAVATANLLVDPLRQGRVTEAMLAQVQQRREFPTRVTQFLQVNAHELLKKVFENPGPAKAPWQLKAVVHIPGLRHVTARVIGVGVRPEHIRGARKKSACDGHYLKKLAVGVGLMAAGAVLAARVLRNFGRPFAAV